MMYTVPERIERDGFLVAYEGEVMSMEEAEARGILVEETVEDAPKPGTKAALLLEAEALGIEVPEGATKAEIEALIDQDPSGEEG